MPAHATLPKNQLEINAMGIPTDQKEIVSIVKMMLLAGEAQGLAEGVYTLTTKTRIPSSGGIGPNIVVCNYNASGIKIKVKHGTENDTRYECYLTKQGTAPFALRDALRNAFVDGTFKPTIAAPVPSMVHFPKQGQESAASQPPKSPEAPTSPEPVEEQDEHPSLRGFTNESIGLELMLLELDLKFKDQPFSSAEFAKIMRNKDLCAADCTNRSIGQILRYMRAHELLVKQFTLGHNDNYRMGPKGKIALETAYKRTQERSTQSTAPQIDRGTQIGLQISQLEEKVKGYNEAVARQSTLNAEIGEIEGQLTEIERRMASLAEEQRLQREKLAPLVKEKGLLEKITSDPNHQAAAKKLAVIMEALS